MKRLRLTDGMDERARRYALDAALLLGFQSETATFPVTCADTHDAGKDDGRQCGGFGQDTVVDVPHSEEELAALWTQGQARVTPPDDWRPVKKGGPLFSLDFRKEKGLETLFSEGWFLHDEDQDLLPEHLDVKIVLPADADRAMVAAACDVAFRFGMETTAYTGSIAAPEGYAGNAVVFVHGSAPEVTYENHAGVIRVQIKGDGDALTAFVSRLCNQFPLVGGMRSWREALMDLTDDLILRGADGQLAALAAHCEKDAARGGNYTIYAAPSMTRRQKERFPDVTFEDYKSGRLVKEWSWELPWEADEWNKVLEKELYPKLRPGDCVRIEGALSEDEACRKRLSGYADEQITAHGARLEECQLLCAYKQGYSWVDEVVIPALQDVAVRHVEIAFRPFMPEGQTEWLDENGATPSYHNLQADTPDKWYDLPIRYLQELYPIEDVLARKLGISRDEISFTVYEGDEPLTYLCRVTSEDQAAEHVRTFFYLAECSERPYLDAYPQMGKVHPATGYLRVTVNGKERIHTRIITDLERIWDVYQREVLPAAKAYVEEKTKGAAEASMQPFFQQLKLEVFVSEPDYRVGCREDLISSLDAFHEDLYFVGSDFFKNYGLDQAGEIFDAPGLILPVIHNREGAPVFRVSLYERKKECACLYDGDRLLEKERERGEAQAWITKIAPEDGKLAVTVRTKGAFPELLKAYAALYTEGILESSAEISDQYRIYIEASGQKDGEEETAVFSAVAPAKEMPEKRRITDVDLHESELIGYETCCQILNELRGVDGIEVFRTARSYQGRNLYAIWLKPEYEGYLSMTKRISLHPSEIINARHHANEVSSTNAAFLFLRQLLTDERYAGLSDRLNLVIVPMENVDGTAIHYELQKEHPYWKLHVARFNAIGKEFYYDHFQDDTIHGEAMGLTRLFEKFVPDMIVDNHGVPSHEWEQQFSGYTSPSYKGFWLPRSLLYGYFWYVTNPEYGSNYAVNKVMEDVIANAILEQPEMRTWNLEWSARFEKYAHAWMPKLFPADYYKEMINYWIPFAADPNHRYPSIRFPWITTVAYTSEVADETAQGAYLNLCARAHAAHDEVTIQMLLKAKHVMDACFTGEGEKIFARYQRQRPMLVSDAWKK